ncbi:MULTISPECIES: sulfite exporter TauE/SafE family protein [Pseudomonas]|uniref:Probable membrane transporter protein n=1 Tax=Pseudomonas eucalypticola TaxID=2599595 RepID=A0A7D5D5N5_9PSED|nr:MULTISPECIES: sulfite exporter TauE/SafE family protein [Pseudomonas]QKZ03312.1 sulfite exporter TauE/SafE family protein [Pseudomonas eucalypticola]WAH57727.1 sulfite exporter TauE/SafE family protein [Pseudomonas silvicola]
MSDAFAVGLPGYAIIFAALLCAYIIFGIAGFGTALIASPVLVLYIPIAKIVPLLALMDLCAALVNVSRDGRKADWRELRRLVPLMVVGSLIGAAILLKARPDILLLALGIFVVGYSLYSLSGLKPDRTFSPASAIPFGSVGGVFSALFGSGGFIYAIYLSGRIKDKNAMRITQTTLIGLSTLTRVVLFALAGVYLDSSLLWLALFLAPGMLLGTAIGRRLTLKMSREQFLKLINIVVLASGVALIIRYFS